MRREGKKLKWSVHHAINKAPLPSIQKTYVRLVMANKSRRGWDKNRSEKGGFVAIPHCVIRSHGYANLSAYAVKLLNDFLSQYYGSNNGDFHAAYSLMRNRRWKSKGTLNRAIKELIGSGFVEVSRQGGRNKCSLYAVTFYAVDECKGKLDILATDKPRGIWKRNEPVPDIQTLQREKKEKDGEDLLNMIMERAKQKMNHACPI